jgi:multiple antibiotic resistance protein
MWTESFIQLFIAVDAPGILTIFLAAVVGLDAQRRRTLIVQSCLGAAIIGSAFFLFGEWVLRLLGVSVADFQVAGGILLVVLSLQDLLAAQKPRRPIDPAAGIVPFAVPLIVGPAVMTTSISLLQRHGLLMTTLAFGANLLIVAVGEWFGLRLVGPRTSRILLAMSKVIAVLLAAMGVKMARQGLMVILAR